LPDTTSKNRFSDRVANYVKYRPGYPDDLIDFIVQQTNLSGDKIIADIGSGTGISAKLFLEKNYTLYGVEPNEPMRQAAEEYLRPFPKFQSINGSAENTNLPGNCIDLIICAQAFHWFNNRETKNEFIRIAKENASLTLIWNDRKANEPFQQAYEKVIQDFSIDYNEVTHRNISEEQVRSFFHPHPVAIKTFYYAQQFDWEGFLGRVVSSSYMPDEKHPNYPQMKEALADIYHTFNKDGFVTFAYDTKLYFGKIK
jgi:ubiquinone/menaquinone biosynthesis C-methylase UbiE